MDKFTKNDDGSIKCSSTVYRIYRLDDLLREREMLVCRQNALYAEIEANDKLLAECEKLGIK